MRKLSPINKVLIFCGIGSIVRLIYGYLFTPWTHAPDHIAFEILLQDGSLSYDQFIHYPHEGGSILNALLSHLITPFTNFSSLTLVAFMLDFASRFVQLYVVMKIFNSKILTVFGVWTIFATAAIIPWGTVNFGLHSISSFFPFVLLYILHFNQETRQYQVKSGIFLGIACWFSYSNFVLVPVYFLFQLLRHNSYRNWIYSFLSLISVVFVHTIVRLYADPGFQLEETSVTSIRGTRFSLENVETWKGIYQVWGNALPQVAAGVETSWEKIVSVNMLLWQLLFLIGIIGCIKSVFLQKEYHRNIAIGFLTVLFFIFIYALSPFYYNSEQLANYVVYRHLSYILPMLSLCIIIGLNSFRRYTILATVFLCIGIYSTGALFTQKPSTFNAEKAAGWVLAVKLGHDPERLYAIIAASNYDQSQLLQGVGWGVCAVLFSNHENQDQEAIVQQISKAKSILTRFPANCKPDLLEGIDFAFSNKVTPRLNGDVHELLLKHLLKTERENW